MGDVPGPASSMVLSRLLRRRYAASVWVKTRATGSPVGVGSAQTVQAQSAASASCLFASISLM